MNGTQKVLIVDDDPVNLLLLKKALGGIYDISSAINGYDAITLVKENPPDIILLDVMMPDLSGFDVCCKIKAEEIYADIPIIFLSAADNTFFELAGLKAGGIDYLTKPVNIDLLKLRVRNHLESKRRNDIIKKQQILLAHKYEELEMAHTRVKLMEGTLTICADCKKIKNDT